MGIKRRPAKLHVIEYNCQPLQWVDSFKVIEKCTNFYFWNRKITPEVLRIDQYCEKILGMLATKSFFSVRFGVAALPNLLPYW